MFNQVRSNVHNAGKSRGGDTLGFWRGVHDVVKKTMENALSLSFIAFLLTSFLKNFMGVASCLYPHSVCISGSAKNMSSRVCEDFVQRINQTNWDGTYFLIFWTEMTFWLEKSNIKRVFNVQKTFELNIFSQNFHYNLIQKVKINI